MSEHSAGVSRKQWALVAIISGVAWAAAPAVVSLLDVRIINAVYLLPLALMFGTFYELGDEIATASLSLIGYLTSGIGMLVLAAGSLLEALFDVGRLATWGVAQGQVFYLGLFGVLLGSLFLGVGLLRERRLWYGGLGLILVLPFTVVGFWAFNVAGWDTLNWIPIMVPYGGAWMTLGIEIFREA